MPVAEHEGELYANTDMDGIQHVGNFQGMEERLLTPSDPHFLHLISEQGVADVEDELSDADFEALVEGYRHFLEIDPETVDATAHRVDWRRSFNAGQKRTELKLGEDGKREKDPKNTFHFSEHSTIHWLSDQFTASPEFKDWVRLGQKVQDESNQRFGEILGEMERVFPGLRQLYYPEGVIPVSFLRLVIYDLTREEYEDVPMFDPDNPNAEQTADFGITAGWHVDSAGWTRQKRATRPGLVVAPSNIPVPDWAGDGTDHGWMHNDLEVVQAPNNPGMAKLFPSVGHYQMYGDRSQFRPLLHGAAEIPAAGLDHEERVSLIHFHDMPYVNFASAWKAGTHPEFTFRPKK